ncbi:MAG: MltA domain-containing protein [Rhodobacteraceae bacterium]|nr:MltA domain-containing protein [Paracoccaceae bacterium]
MLTDLYIRTSFAEMDQWTSDDHKAALSAFLRFCDGNHLLRTGPFKLGAKDRKALCQKAEVASEASADSARAFFETEFVPFEIARNGFVTGYFEPELGASRVKSERHFWPLRRAPQGLSTVKPGNRPKGWPSELSYGRMTKAGLRPLPNRAEIMAGALDDEDLEFVYLEDPIDAFFIHVQGSARLKLAEGGAMRVGFAGKSGHPYTSIAKRLVERGEGTPDQLTMSGLRKWLSDNPDKRDELFAQNQSYIFFREIEDADPEKGPIGAAGLPLVPGRSIAVDLAQLSLGLPLFVAADLAGVDGFNADARLMIADDTGSAIKGPARGDLFIGSGEHAGKIAGEIRHRAKMTVLIPNALAGALQDRNG